MSTEWSGLEGGDGTEVASSRFRVDVVPTSRSRRLVTFLPSMTETLFGEMAPRWLPYAARVVDLRSGRCVFEPEGFGDTSDYAEALQADLHRMSVDEFCEQWSIDREGIGSPPRPARSPAGQADPLSEEQLATAASERLLRFVG
ncbi:MAG TPA: hypothetical protein VGR26_07515, partial [Acidimicrobiales bacterium]|nr:hypothetical protein [Acidimicrobiales bacterium]